MALILEVLGARRDGVRTRVRLDALPVTIGRALDNDVILDDPYADAHHVRITTDMQGGLVVEDLGSTNGLVVAATGERAPSVPVHTGTELRVGQTILRFRDTTEPVPPALPDGSAQPIAVGRWLESRAGRTGLIVAATALAAVYGWLASFERTAASDALGAAMLVPMVGLFWAGLWAVAGRVVVHRFAFGAHFAIVAAALIAGMAIYSAAQWAAFLFPASALTSWISSLLFFALLAALVAMHLAWASNLPRRRRWRSGIVTSGVFGLVMLITFAAEGQAFSDVPSFVGTLKPYPPALLPTLTADEFVGGVDELREEVDALAEKARADGF